MSNARFVRRGLSRIRAGQRDKLLVHAEASTSLEVLEPRTLLSAISWDGDAGDNLWQSAANWSGNVVPTAADDVTIDVAANPTILLNAAAGNRSVHSLVLRENLTISGGSTLTVGTTASIETGGLLSLTSGRLAGGAWTAGSGMLAIDSNLVNNLSGLTWNGPIDLADAGDRLSIGVGVTVNGIITLSGQSTELGLVNGATINSEVLFPGMTAGRRIGATANNATYTFGPSAVIHGSAFTIAGQYGGSAWGGTTVVNMGVIGADTAGQTITISPATFTNTGTLNIGPGNISVDPINPWTSSGAMVNVSSGTLTLDGTYSTSAGIGSWTRSGGSVSIVGTVDNTGGTLNLNASTGIWELASGNITGGTINVLAGGGLGMNSNANNRLNSLTFNGDITLADAGDRLSLGMGVTVNGVITLSGQTTELGLANGASVNTEVVFPGAATGRRIGASGNNATYTFGPGANVHGTSFIIGGQYGGSAWGGTSVVNQGAIGADVAGQTVTINPVSFSSTGTLNVAPGNITVSPVNSWSSSGSAININGGTLTIDGTYATAAGIGAWSRAGGAVNILGTVDNTGGTLNLDAATGTWELTGGTITGGTVSLLAGGGLGMNNSANNRLSNLTFNGDITIADAGDRLSLGVGVSINGVITLSGQSTELGLVNGASINSTVVFPGAATGRRIGAVGNNATYTFGPGANIHGTSFIIGGQFGGSAWGGTSVVNQGVISADLAGQTVTINPVSLTSTGTLNAGPGNITVSPLNAWTSSSSNITINGGTLTIDGTYTTAAGIGTWSRTGGTVNVVGTVDNTGGTLNLDAATGTWELAGGTITGGTVNLLAGGGLGVNSLPSNRLSNLTFNGNITLADASDRLSLGVGVTVNGVIMLTGQSSELGLVNGASVNTEVSFPGAVNGRRIGATGNNATYTFGPGATIHGGSFFIGGQYGGSAWGGTTVVNQGTISADAAGQTVTINPANFTNTGTLNVGPGSITVSPVNAWTSAGSTIIVNAGTLTIDGTYVTGAGIGSWSRTGGAVNIIGTVDNTGGTLNLNASTGVWELTGGNITGGTVNPQAGGGLGVNSLPSNRLSNLTFNGDITLADASDRLSFGQTVTINGIVSLVGNNTELGLVSGSVLNSEIIFPGAATGRRIGTTSNGATYTFGPGANIHGGPFIIGGQYGGSAWGGTSVVNQGTIAADVAGQTATINPVTFTNAGVLTAGPGNLTINTSGTWSSSAGTINVNAVTFSIDGTFVTAGGIGAWHNIAGIVNVPGIVDNTDGAVNLDAGTGVWTLTGGSIMGGVVTIGAGGGLGVNSSASNRLSNTMVIGNITLADASDRISFGQAVTVSGVVTLAAANTEVGIVPGAVFVGEIAAPGNISGRRIGTTGNNGTYTFGPGALVHGGTFTIAGQYGGSAWGGTSVVNQGTIRADTAGQAVTITPVVFMNQGTIAADAGNVVIAPASGAFTNAGTIRIAPGSTVNVTGAYSQAPSGALQVQINGVAPSNVGRLIVSGIATLDGSLTVTLTNGFSPACMNVQILSASLRMGEFASATLPPPPGDHQSLVVYTGDQVRFAISPPSDYNRDGVLNSQDFFDFLGAFFSTGVDFNHDGVVNSQDYFDFLNDFFAGC